MEKARQHGFDNVRFILIFCVVLGHLLERGGRESGGYLLIYTFHMPAFLFLSGWFARFQPRRLLTLAGLYLCFQFLYRAMESILFHAPFSLELFTPYWLLWYLPVLLL